MHKSKVTIYIFFILFTMLNSLAFGRKYEPPTQVIIPSAYQVDLLGSSWSTTSFYDNEGAELTMDEGSSFEQIDGEGVLRYGMGKKLELRGGISYRQISSTDASANNVTAAGIKSFFGGIKYALAPKKKWRFAVDIEYAKSAFANTEYTSGQIPDSTEQVLGDDGTSIKLGGHVAYLLDKVHFLSSSIFYHAPPNELSAEIVYNIESAWAYNNWAFALGVDGIFSFGQDQFSDIPTEKPPVAKGNTYLYNSINRERVAPYGAIYYASSKWLAGLKASQVMRGVSTDQGKLISLNFSWLIGGVTKASAKISKFKEYIIEAEVTKVSPRGKFLQINQGLSRDVEKGMKFDIYETDFLGGNKMVATGYAYEVSATGAIIKLTKRYKKISIKKGFAARGY